MSMLKLDDWRCKQCGHRWVPRVITVKVVTCPKCKSPNWNRAP